MPAKTRECFSLLVEAVQALQRENKEVLWGSMVKETMKRKRPSFNEGYYGFRSFSHALEEARRRGIVKAALRLGVAAPVGVGPLDDDLSELQDPIDDRLGFELQVRGEPQDDVLEVHHQGDRLS